MMDSWTWSTCVRVSPLVSGMTHQDQIEVRRQMKEKVKRVGEMPSIRQRFGITLIVKVNVWREKIIVSIGMY